MPGSDEIQHEAQSCITKYRQKKEILEERRKIFTFKEENKNKMCKAYM